MDRKDSLVIAAGAVACVGLGAFVAARLSQSQQVVTSLEEKSSKVVERQPSKPIPEVVTKLRIVTVSQPEEKRSVTVQVPATSANLGCGYDTLGMALDMWNEVTLTRSDKFEIICEGEGVDDIPLDETNLVYVGVKVAYEAMQKPVPNFKYELKQRIPHGRGLGSSSAAICGGLLAAMAISGHKLDTHGAEELLQLAVSIEGHPDNVAPAIYGGLQMGLYSNFEKRWMTSRVQLPHGLIFVIFIPGFTGKTTELRKCVPKEFSAADCVFNMSRIAWLVNALLTNDIKHLKEGFEDRMHQRQRGDACYPHMQPLIDAAYEAGAIGAYLSGSGPCVMAIADGGIGDFFTQSDQVQRKDIAIAAAMRSVADDMKVVGKVYVTHPAACGGVVIAADPPYSTPLLAFNGDT